MNSSQRSPLLAALPWSVESLKALDALQQPLDATPLLSDGQDWRLGLGGGAPVGLPLLSRRVFDWAQCRVLSMGCFPPRIAWFEVRVGVAVSVIINAPRRCGSPVLRGIRSLLRESWHRDDGAKGDDEKDHFHGQFSWFRCGARLPL
jgi:hypothetical protein